MFGLTDKLKNEPVAIAAVARIVAALAGKYGIALSDGEILALLVALEPIVMLLTRRLVSPVKAES